MAKDTSLNINLGLDANNAKKIIDGISNDMEVLVNKKNVISVSADTSKAKNQVKELNSSVQAIQDKKIRLELDAKATQTDISKITNQLDLLTKNKKKIEVDLAKAESDITQFKQKITSILQKEAKLEINSNDAKAEIDKIQLKINAIKDKKAKLQIDASNSDIAINKLKSSIDSIDENVKIDVQIDSDDINKTANATDNFDGSVKKVNKSLSLTDKLAKFGLVADGIQNVADSLNGVTNSYVALDTATNKIETLGGKAKENATAFRELSLSMSEEIPIGAEALQTATYEALSAGISATKEDIASFMDTSAKLAVGGGEEVGNTVNLLSSVLNAYGESAQKSAEYSDVLFQTVNLGKTSIPELSASLSQVVPTASAMGFALKDVGAALAIMTAKGVPTAQATTKLNALLVEIQKPGAELSKIFKKAGTSSEELGKKIKSGDTYGALQDIKTAFEESGKSATQALSQEAGSAFNVLTQNMEGLKTTMQSFDNATGTTEKAFADMTDSIENRTKLMKNKLDNFVTGALDSMGGLGTGIVVASKTLTEFAPAITAITGLKTVFGDTAKSAIETAKSIASKLVPSLSAQAGATTAATGAQEGLNVAQSANPMGAIVLAIIAVVGAMYLLYKNVDSVKKVFDSAFAFIKDVIGGIITALSPLIGAFKAIGNFILTLFLAPFKVVYGVIEGVVKSLSGATEKTQTWGQYIAKLKPIFEKISGVISTIYNAFSKFVDFVVNSIVAFLVPKVQWLIAIFGELSSYLYDKVVGVFEYLYEKLKPLIDGIAFVANKASEVLSSMFKDPNEEANKYAKEVQENSKMMLDLFNQQKTALYAIKDVNADILKKKRNEIEAMKQMTFAQAQLITNEKAKARQLEYINNIYADADKQLKVLESQIKKTNKNVVNTPIDPEAVKKATSENLEYLKNHELLNAQLIESEREKELKILEINNKYNLRKLELEKASEKSILGAKETYESKKREIEGKYNLIDVKEREKILADSENNHRETLKTEVEILQDYVNKGIATEQDLTDFRSKQLELRRSENEKQINDLLKQDTEYNKERAKIEKQVELGKIDTDSAINALQIIAKNRLEILTQNDERIKLILEKNALSYADFEKKLTADTENYLADIKISQIENRSERERETSINNAKKTLANDLLLAKNNNDLKLQANLKYIEEVKKANLTFERASENTFIKLGRTAIESLRNSFNNVKAIINQTTQLSDPKALKEFSERESELQKQREEGAISYEQYAEKYKQLEKEKADATANATKTSIDWIKTLATSMSSAFADMTKQFTDLNANLATKFNENLESIKTAKALYGEKSSEVTALTTANQQLIDEAFINTGAIAGATFAQMIADGASATKAFVLTALASMKALLPIITFQIYGKQIAELGPWGIPVASALVAVLTGLMSAAESGIKEMNFANGGLNVFGGFGDGKHSTTKTVVSRVGETGKAEYVFNPTTTSLTGDKVLDEINNRKISVQQWASEKYNGVMDKISNRLDSIENVLKVTKFSEFYTNYNIKSTNNVVQTVTQLDLGRC